MAFGPFSTPYFEGGTTVSPDVPVVFPVAIAGHPYTIDLREYERSSLDVVRQQADSSAEPSEQTFNPFGLWRRSLETWHHGAGQINFDLRDESDRARFRSSKGVDVWTAGELSLLPDTDQKLASAATNLKMVVAGTRLYVIDGQTTKFTSDITPGTPSFTSVTGTPAETPTSITSDGFHVWIAYPSGVYTTNTGTSVATAFGTQDADIVTYANGRLIVAHDHQLFELDNAGLATAIFTHPLNTSFVFDALAASPNAIYAAGHSGTHGEVYAISIEETTTDLSSVVSCAALPEGEYVTCVYAYVGVIVLGTNKGVRLSAADGAATLNYGVLIPTPASVTCMDGVGQFVWFGWSNYDSVSTGLGRLDLSVFTDTLRPAYASDLMVTGQGAVPAVVTFGGLKVLSVAGLGVYAEDPTRVASGSIDSGVIRWGTTERKTVHSVDLRTEPLPAGSSVAVLASWDGGLFGGVSTLSTTSATAPPEPFFAQNNPAEQVEVRLTLGRATATTTGPTVMRSTLRAIVSPTRAEQIVVPVILTETVTVGPSESQEHRQDTASEFRWLKALEAAGAPVTYQEGEETWTVTVEKVQLKPRSWTEQRRWLNGTCFVTLRTIG